MKCMFGIAVNLTARLTSSTPPPWGGWGTPRRSPTAPRDSSWESKYLMNEHICEFLKPLDVIGRLCRDARHEPGGGRGKIVKRVVLGSQG